MNIKKFSTDMKNFYDIGGTLDKTCKRLIFKISSDKFEEIFGVNIHALWLGIDNITDKIKNVYILGADEKYYSCIGSIFSIKTNQNVVEFSSVAINLVLENILTESNDISTKKVTFNMYYLGHPIHTAYINSYSFKYTATKTITLKKYTDENLHIDITVESKEESVYSKLSKIIYNVIEMIMLMWGDIPYIDGVEIEHNGEKIIPYFEVVDKYRGKKQRSNGKEILGNVSLETINKKNLKEFERFRKNTKIIYDLYMNTVNSSGYKEIKNCNLIQIMEGLYKTIIKKDELRNILYYYFTHSKSAKKLLTRKDKRCVKDPNSTQIFIYKAVNHRNYLSHLNLKQNKNVFYELENIYAYWKLNMSIRIFILEHLNIKYDEKKVSKYIKEITDWAKENKLRFSAKIN